MHSDNITHPMSERQQKVVDTLKNLGIEFDIHFHPPIPTIEEAINYWKEFDSTHCKNLFFRNHKGNKHYLVLFECMHQMDIHVSVGLPEGDGCREPLQSPHRRRPPEGHLRDRREPEKGGTAEFPPQRQHGDHRHQERGLHQIP